jgi:hypothetical protein
MKRILAWAGLASANQAATAITGNRCYGPGREWHSRGVGADRRIDAAGGDRKAIGAEVGSAEADGAGAGDR